MLILGSGGAFGTITFKESELRAELARCDANISAIEKRLDRERVEFHERMDRIDGRVDKEDSKWFPHRHK